MAIAEKRKAEPGVIGRLAEKGEETIHRLVEEAEKNRTVGEALNRAAAAKGKLDSASRAALHQIGLAPAEDVRELRRQVEALEARVAKLESAKKPAARKPAAKKPSAS